MVYPSGGRHPATELVLRYLRPFGRAEASYGRGFCGTRKRVPFRILDGDGDRRERERVCAMPTSQNESRPIRRAQGSLTL